MVELALTFKVLLILKYFFLDVMSTNQVVVTFDFCCSLYVLEHLILVFSTFHLLQHDYCLSGIANSVVILSENKLGSDHNYIVGVSVEWRKSLIVVTVFYFTMYAHTCICL